MTSISLAIMYTNVHKVQGRNHLKLLSDTFPVGKGNMAKVYAERMTQLLYG